MKPGVDYIGVCTPFYCHDGQGHFLLHRRSSRCRDEHGHWDTGLGQLHFGETPAEGVLREVFEEYGCRGEIDEQLPAHSIVRAWGGATTHWLAIPFFVRVNPAEVKRNDPGAMDELGWFTLDRLPTPLHTGLQFTLAHYPEYFDKYHPSTT